MPQKTIDLILSKCGQANYDKLEAFNNLHLLAFIGKYIELCNPKSVYVCNDSEEDRQYIINKAIEKKEELNLATKGHTIHFDGPKDQARDKGSTKYLLSKGMDLGEALNSIDKDEGIKEVYGFLKDIMKGGEAYVLFFSLGPTNSEFSIPCVQITDSAYVAHSEYILYRQGYEQFKKVGDSSKFFKYVHSAGELENGVSKNVDKRRVYIDLDDNIVYSTNTQYAGNTVGLKKLSLRLAIKKASEECWLAEHMLVMGVHGPNNRKTYFTGAFPSACGKTSTAMLQGETIVGDDIAYLRKKDGKIYAANVECGIFGIIRDVNPKDDPVIWKILNSPGEVIFSNVLVDKKNNPYWLGDGRDIPQEGVNYSGEWQKGKKDAKGNEISHSHKNARYTVSLGVLDNVDPELNNPKGVEVSGVIYGGRDSSTWPPVQEAFDWEHGIITMGASLESETTAATLGKEGVRQFSPMANYDFVSIPLGKYIMNHLGMGQDLSKTPQVFSVNYFQKDTQGKYMTAMEDKRVWVKWMELRVNGDVDVIKIPTGNIPLYEDIKKLFKDVLGKEYTEENYRDQFGLKVKENIEKIQRITEVYKSKVSDAPQVLFDVLTEQKKRLESVWAKHGDCVAPSVFIK
ncbi:phosphoenolpyruvate carboxykinase (GTP) [Thermoproteota archaeon]